MKKQLIIFSSLLFFISSGIAQDVNDIELSIHSDSSSRELITLTIKNNQTEVLKIDCFGCPENKVIIYSPEGYDLSYKFSYCGINNALRYSDLLPNTSKSWTYDINDRLRPSYFNQKNFSYDKGRYKVEWTVEGVKAEVYYYDLE